MTGLQHIIALAFGGFIRRIKLGVSYRRDPLRQNVSQAGSGMYVGEVHEDSREVKIFRRAVLLYVTGRLGGCTLKMRLAKRDLDLMTHS